MTNAGMNAGGRDRRHLKNFRHFRDMTTRYDFH